MIRVGDVELHAVSDGTFRLDGGAMFGIVPKPAWEKVTEVDDRNRITLSLTTLLIKAGGKKILVDTGIGTKHDAKFNDMYKVSHPPDLVASLARIGLKPFEIDLVILSHLHFDHAGGATTRNAAGEIEPAFPWATYIVQEGMWHEAQEGNPRCKGSYMPEDFLPLERTGRLKLVRGDHEVVPGVRCILTGGHVKHHQVVQVESAGEKALYWADLLPTAQHVKPAWVMGYDLYPAEVASLKQRMVADAVRERWVNVFEHDPKTAMARFEDDGKGGVRVVPLELVGA